MDLDLADAVLLDFPLRGEWCALNTPAERIPSHGTDYFGQRYAFDFVQLDSGGHSHPRGLLRQLVGVLPASAFYCWGQPVYSAGTGRVLAAGDGWPDRRRVNGIWELVRGLWIGARPSGADYRPLTGNFVLIEGAAGVALYAHLRNGSVAVTAGERVGTGTLLGSVGNSGNSTMPHLHFHLMDGPDPMVASGVLCAFRRYERFDRGAWEPVDRGVPGPFERVRAG
jgi:hypothetical protein